jgi:membrane-bound inhibitor of C-type lysozyme
MRNEPEQSVSQMRVVKKLAPTSRGAIRLAERFGETLICVRHRVDAKAKYRFTTVELLVERAPIKVRSEKLVAVQVDWDELSLQQVVRAAGARWDGKARVWRMPRRLAGILRLTERISKP